MSNERSDKLSALIDLFQDIDEYTDSPNAYFHRILDVAVQTIDEAEMGTVSIVRNGTWRFVAAIGHQTESLLGLELDASWDLATEVVQEFENLERLHERQFPEGLGSAYQGAVGPAVRSLVAAYQLEEGVKVAVSVDIPNGSDREFSASSRRAFAAFVKLAGTYQRSVYDQEQLSRTAVELQSTTHKLQQILSLTDRLVDDGSSVDSYLKQLLQTALLVVDEADYGSVSLVYGNTWRFAAAVGHDEDRLKALALSAEWVRFSPGVAIHEDMLDFDAGTMPEDVYREIVDASEPIKSTAVISVELMVDRHVLVTLDISADSEARFSDSSQRIISAFASMATSFLKLRLNAEVMNDAYLGFARKLAIVAEAFDDATAKHNERVSQVAARIAEAIGCSGQFVRQIRDFAGLHDIGKVFLDRRLIRKNGPLSEEEWRVVRDHTSNATQLLSDPWFAVAGNIAKYHHERWDGSGYPEGRARDLIPLEAQIVGVADVFDALRSHRSYKTPHPAEECLRRMRHGDERLTAGQFSPRLLDALEKILADVDAEIYSEDGLDATNSDSKGLR